jgi:hypothetical protein
MKDLIEKTEVEEKIQNRKRSRQPTQSSGGGDAVESQQAQKKKKFTPHFRQERAIAMEYDDSEKKINSQMLQRIFQKSKQ